WDERKDFRQVMRQDAEVTSRLKGKALEDLFDYRYYVQHVDETFKRAGI
ncbi:MAG: adenylosuccinate lyase, partial [Chloroflexi bacterium]|nr:adenylosuccinate lyase [Chloroflexota bacterium]